MHFYKTYIWIHSDLDTVKVTISVVRACLLPCGVWRYQIQPRCIRENHRRKRSIPVNKILVMFTCTIIMWLKLHCDSTVDLRKTHLTRRKKIAFKLTLRSYLRLRSTKFRSQRKSSSNTQSPKSPWCKDKPQVMMNTKTMSAFVRFERKKK